MVSRRRRDLSSQESDFLAESVDLLLLVLDTAVQFADQIVSTQNGLLTLLVELHAKVDDLFGQNALNIRCPLKTIQRRFAEQFLYKVTCLHHMEDRTALVASGVGHPYPAKGTFCRCRPILGVLFFPRTSCPGREVVGL
jgi:hypothetical protein